MHRDWKQHRSQILLAVLLLVVIGLAIDELAWTLVLGMAVYLWWTLMQARNLHQWLYQKESGALPPQSKGLWGELFDGIYNLQRNNVKAQSNLQELINRGQESVNALQTAVIMTNDKGALEWWNDSAVKLLGLRNSADRGQLIQNLIRDPAFSSYFNSKHYQLPLTMQSPSRPHLILQFQITLFGEDDRLIIVEDVTRMHHLEQMRRDFVSNVSHEMRTPLTVISGYLETLQDQLAELTPRWQKAVGTMSTQAQRMEALITDLLLLAKLEATGHQPTESSVDVEFTLRSIIKDANTLSGENNHCIRLNMESNGVLLGDEGQYRSAFSNLIFNAVKYTPALGEIDIRWWVDKQGGHLSVKDTGVGFDPIHIPRLTERFYRADSSRYAKTGGTGLGLAIVKHVLINHDGKLSIHSEPGAGSEFVCHFPQERLGRSEDSPTAAKSQQSP